MVNLFLEWVATASAGLFTGAATYVEHPARISEVNESDKHRKFSGVTRGIIRWKRKTDIQISTIWITRFVS